MTEQKAPKGWELRAENTALEDLESPEKVVDFVEQILALHERQSGLLKARVDQSPASFEELASHVEQGKFDMSSVDLVGSKRQFLETATLFPHDPQYQAFRQDSSLNPRDVSVKGIFEALEYAKDDRERRIYLKGVDLSYMDLSGHCFYQCDLSQTQLECADLRGADLVQANLSGADLSEADLRGADLTDADLTGATVRNALFQDAVLDPDAVELVRRGGGILQGDPQLLNS